MQKIYLTLIFIVSTFTLFSQSKQHPLIPQSPNAGALGKYGDIDVSLYTGQINPNVKLFNIKFNDFSFPIDLNYASSGLKVHETPSSVGMGWSLSGTGVINRQVRSVPDEQNHGYNGLLATASTVQSIINGNYNPSSPYNSLTQDQFKLKIGQTDFDGEPDLFNFSFSGYGGKFIFDETQTGSTLKNAVFIPRQAMSVAATFNYNATGQLFNAANTKGLIEKFVFTDPKGVKYTFDQREGAILDDDDYQYGKNIVSTWYLTKIVTPNGNSLTFNYIQRTIDLPHAQSEYRYLYLVIPFGGGGLDFNPKKTVSRSTTTETVLQEILINNGDWGKVEFVENTADRTDWDFSQSGTKPKSLKEVILKNGDGNIVRKFGFSYAPEITNRLVLRSVTEYGTGGITANEAHQFEYYSESDIPALPSEGSDVINREDNWGYYNGNTSGTLLPDYVVVIVNSLDKSGSKKDTLTKEQFAKYVDSLRVASKNIDPNNIKENPTPTPASLNSNVYYVTANNRNANWNYALIGQLKKITYPTKGSTEFVYEANSYFSNVGEEFNPCSGNYVNIATAFKGIPLECGNQSTTFTVADGAFSCLKVNYNITIFSQGQDIIDGSVKIFNSNNVAVFSDTLRGINSQNPIPNIGSKYVVLAPGTYRLFAELCGENASSYNASSARIDLTGIAVTPNNYVTRESGGLRIKEVKDCPSTVASQCLTKEYNYTSLADPNNSSGRIVTNGKYYFPVDYFTLTNINASALYLNSASQLPLSTTLGHYVGYKTVIVKEVTLNALNQKIYKGKTVFEYKSPDELDSPDINSTNYPYVSVAYDWVRGVVTQSKVYDQAGDWVKDNQNDYVLKPSLDYQKFTGLKSGKFIHNTEIAPSGSDPNIFIFRSYPSVSGFQFNQQSIQKEQFKVGNVLSSIESTTDYVYGNDIHLQPTQTSTTSSKGETLVMQYQYPHDIIAGDLASSASSLRTAGRRAELLQTETFRNGVSINKSQNFYATFGSNLLPSKQRNFIGGSVVPATETQQLGYDSYGNLTSFKEINGIIHSFMWGYKGQYPVVYMMNGVPANPSALLNETSASVITTTANSLRSTFPNAHISHYAYQPMIGLISQTNPAQIKTSFSYDGLNRLEKVFDNAGYILKAYDYQIATTVGGNNYVKEMMPRNASTTLQTGYQNVQTTLSYVDGLGRPLQVVAQQAGGDGTNDMVTNATTYDGYGRVAKSYIPYPNAGFGALAPLPTSFDGDTHPYSENILFDNSPLNRLFQVMGVGMAWQTANKFVDYQYKVAGTEIRNFVIQADGSVNASGFYPANSLYNTVTTSERGFATIEIKDKEGKIIAKYQQLQAGFVYAITHYVYDKNNFLRFVIPPEVYNKFGTGVGQVTSFTENDELFKEGMYGYHYDAKGRQIEKHILGAGWTRYVYDKINRIVLENDDKDAASSPNFYKFTKYDFQSRPIQTGLINNIGQFSRSQLQADFDNHTGPIHEERGTALLGYTNVSFPYDYTPGEGNLRTVTYYDDLLWQTDNAYNFQSANAYHVQQTNLKGMITGNLVRNLETNDWYKYVNYYDYKGRNIQTFAQNHLGGIDRTDFNYRFNNEVLKMRSTHKKTGAMDIVELYEYEYNHVGKKTGFKHSKDGILKNIAKYEYDQIQRLKIKRLSPSSSIGSLQTGNWNNSNTWLSSSIPSITDNVVINSGHIITIPSGQTGSAGSLFNAGTLRAFGIFNLGTTTPNSGISDLQTVDYKYHIRGGLRGINLDASGNLTNKLFSMKLGYEDAGFYDGNIGKQEFRNSLDNVTRSFTYGYDGASRIQSGVYSGNGAETYSLNSVTYDLNGNIKTLSRNGLKSNNTFGVIDNLAYTYNSNSNKILKVDDISNETASFTDVSGNDYTYSPDGSLISDANKGISVIEYNYLKLPKKIVKNGVTILNQYDASGRKLKETIGTQVTDYSGNLIYKNNVIYQLGHEEGRIADGIYEYNINDHLGSLRVSFKDSLGIAKVTQANSYGIFGEDLTTLSYRNTSKLNNYKFTDKENLPETGYTDFGARLYDNLVPRFITVDPLAEISRRCSPYTYANNNPLRFIDPDGMDAVDVAGGVMYTGDDAKNAYIQLQKNRPKEEDEKKEKKYEYLGYSKEAKGYIQQVTNPDGSIYQTKYPFPAPGIQPDYTIEAVLIPIFRPLGWAFNALKLKLFAKVVTNAEVENVVVQAVEGVVAKEGSSLTQSTLNLTTSSTSLAPSRVYTIFDGNGQLFKFGVTDANLLRFNQSLKIAGEGSYGKYSSIITKDRAHLMEKYLRSLHFSSTGQFRLPGMKVPYPINFDTGLPIKP